MSSDVRFLGDLPIFAGLNNAQLTTIAGLLTPMHGVVGTIICREGEAGDSIFVIERGRVQILKRTTQGDHQEVASLDGPTVVGEMALIDGAPRSASARATTEVNCYRLECAAFNALRNAYQPVAYKVIGNLTRMLCDRLRVTNEKIDAFFANPEASLAEMQARQNALLKARMAQRGE